MKTEKVQWTISEVADLIGINKSKIRFWEKEFEWIEPKRKRSGVRKFKREDIEAIKSIARRIRFLGMTLDGVRKAYKYGYDEDLEKIIDKCLGRALEGKLIIENHERSEDAKENEHNYE